FAAVADPFRGEPVVVAARAVGVDRLIVRDKIAIGVARASPELSLAFSAAPLGNVSHEALGAFNSRRHLSRKTALGVPRTANEFAIAARADQQFAFVAFGARLAGLFGRGFAFVLERRLLAAVRTIEIHPKPARFYFGVLRAAGGTRTNGKFLHQPLLDFIEHLFERQIKIGHHRFVAPLARRDGIELLFHSYREIDVEDFREGFYQDAVHFDAQRGRIEPALFLLHVRALLDR